MPAHPYNESSYILGSSSNLLREQYSQDFGMHSFYFGSTLARLFKPMAESVAGDGITIQAFRGQSDSARASLDVLRDFLPQNKYRDAKIKVRFSDSDSSANDFNELQAVAEISDIELVTSASRTPEAIAVDVAKAVFDQLTKSVDESMSVLMHANSAGRIAKVNGTPKQNDLNIWADATATPTGSSCRIKVDNGSIANFQPGRVYDLYTSGTGTLTADYMECTDINPEDLSVGLATTSRTTVANVSSIADNDDIYRSDEYNQGFRASLQATFTQPVSGDSWIGGVNRTTSTNRWLVPKISRGASGTASATIAKSHFDALSLMMELSVPPELEGGYVFLMHPSLLQSLRNSIGDEALSTESSDARTGDYNFGNKALYYIHPYFGRVALMADPLCMPDRVYVLAPSSWVMLNYGWEGMRYLGGEVGGMWRQKNAVTPGAGGSKFWQVQGYQIKTPFCKMPIANGAILNLTT